MNYQVTFDSSSWNELRDILLDRKERAFDYWTSVGCKLDKINPRRYPDEYDEYCDLYRSACDEYTLRFQLWAAVEYAVEVPETVPLTCEPNCDPEPDYD